VEDARGDLSRPNAQERGAGQALKTGAICVVNSRGHISCNYTTNSLEDSGSPAKVASVIKQLEERHFNGLAALVANSDERQEFERWVKKNGQETIRRAVQRAFDAKEPITRGPETPKGPAPSPSLPTDASAIAEIGPTPSRPRKLVPGFRRRKAKAYLWIVGRKQRDDLRANYLPVPVDHVGAYELYLLNRGEKLVGCC
jgi:hypothetical protein